MDDPLEPPIEQTLAANIKRLQAYYRERPELGGLPSSDKALAEATGKARRTIAAAREGSRPAQLDTVQAIAVAYGLHTYQLLVPGLSPENPATVPVTEAEKELWRGVRQSMRRALQGKHETDSTQRVDVGSSPPRTGSRKKVASHDKK